MNAATITVKSEHLRHAARLDDDPALARAFGDERKDCRFSLKPAPKNRGTEIHVSSSEMAQKEMKAKLRVYRALVEAGEAPTGARAR